jgi:hypothetical protein
VTLLLLGMFILFTYLDVISVANMKRYPPTIECNYTDSMFINAPNVYEGFALVDQPYTIAQQGTSIY